MQHQGILLWPQGFSLDAYKAVIQKPEILTGYANTIFYVVVGTSLNVMMTAFMAYGLSRSYLRYTKPIMLMVMVTMFFYGGMIPSYLLVRNLGLLNTRWAILLPTMISTYNLIVMKTSFMSIPISLEEAARIDGASDIKIFFSVIMPLSKSIFAVMILFYGVEIWNSWFNAMLYLKDRDMYPLQLFLREILVQNETSDMMGGSGMENQAKIQETVKYATVVVATIPILCIYPMIQKHFVTGVMIGAVKE
jgi:putative aldouronate transport system permease protein